MATGGLKTIESRYGPAETVTRLEAQIQSHGLTLFASIDHAAGAAEAGLPLRPTTVLIFGNAKTGTPLMQADQLIGIDLPLKALVWRDGDGKTWISYNDPVWLANQHDLPIEAQQLASGILSGLEVVVQKAAGSP